MDNLKEVSKEEFFEVINCFNVHPRIINDKYPYTSEWRLQNASQKIIGKSVDYYLPNSGLTGTKWYLLKGE